MAKKRPIIVPPVDLPFEEAMKRLLNLKPGKNGPEDLPLNCAHCGGAHTIQFEDWTVRTEADPPQSIESQWTCQYCGKEHGGFFPGRIAWAVKRVEDSGESHY